MVGARVYDLLYRYWAPWDRIGVRSDLIELVESGRVDAHRYPRAVDLGCGSGANVVYLASLGFEAWGVDFSEIALEQAGRRADIAGVDATFVHGDLTAESIEGVDGQFDLIVDFGTLDDLRGGSREAMARTVTRLSRPGTVFLEYCFYGVTAELPWISFKGTSRMSHIAPGELEDLFGEFWDVEPLSMNDEWRVATFLLTRR
jgi:SAM-dependent methyltransferase